MSPKTTTIFLAIHLLILTLSITLSSAITNHDNNGLPDFVDPSEILRHYGLPGGLFPENVKSFHYVPIDSYGKEAYLTIYLYTPCNVTRSFPPFYPLEIDTVECQTSISAKISENHLKEVKGVKVYKSKPEPKRTMIVSEVEVTKGYFLFVQTRLVQFKSSTHEESPKFPARFIEQYPKCDSKMTFDYNGMRNDEEMKQEFMASVFNYGRPLLLEA